jgi:hypothetical protein
MIAPSVRLHKEHEEGVIATGSGPAATIALCGRPVTCPVEIMLTWPVSGSSVYG